MTQQDFLLAAENYARALAAFEIAERASSEARYYSSTATLVSKKLPGCGDCLFWCPDGSEHGNGYAHGPGFHAMASEFPEGTVLEVTVRAVLPGEATT